MKLVEKFDEIEDLCNGNAQTNFGKSLASQIGGLFGFGSITDASGINTQSRLLKKIQDLQSRLQTVKWQCSQKIFLTQDINNEERIKVLRSLDDFLNENNKYINMKYMFEEQRLGLLEGRYL